MQTESPIEFALTTERMKQWPIHFLKGGKDFQRESSATNIWK